MSYKTFAPLRNVLCGLSHRTAVLVQGVFVSPLTCIYHFFLFPNDNRNHREAKGSYHKPFSFGGAIPCKNCDCWLRWGWCMLIYYDKTWYECLNLDIVQVDSCYGFLQVYLHTAPLCHIGGISSALALLMAGGCHILLPKFEAKLAIESIEQHNVTSFITVPAMMSDVISFYR